MFEGPRIFFELTMWLGWIVAAVGLYFLVTSIGDRPAVGMFAGQNMLGAGITWAAFCMIGKMIAGIGEELVAIREAAQKKPE